MPRKSDSPMTQEYPFDPTVGWASGMTTHSTEEESSSGGSTMFFHGPRYVSGLLLRMTLLPMYLGSSECRLEGS